MRDLETTNNAIIRHKTAPFLDEVHDQEKAFGIKHNRKYEQRKPRAKFGTAQGDINRISIGLTKGLIMTHKGAGPGNRVAKPFFNPVAEKFCDELAASLAENTGDVICGNLVIR